MKKIIFEIHSAYIYIYLWVLPHSQILTRGVLSLPQTSIHPSICPFIQILYSETIHDRSSLWLTHGFRTFILINKCLFLFQGFVMGADPNGSTLRLITSIYTKIYVFEEYVLCDMTLLCDVTHDHHIMNRL